MAGDFHAQFTNHNEESATDIVNLRIHTFNERYSHWILQSVMSSQQDAPIILRDHYPVIPIAGLRTQHLRMIVFWEKIWHFI